MLGFSLNTPAVKVFGIICIWILLFFPFAIACIVIVRQDALNRFEAYVLGQTSGPVGVWLVLRANRKALEKQLIRNQMIDRSRHAPDELPTEAEMLQRIRDEGLPAIDEMPGGRAFRPPSKQARSPSTKRVKMDGFSLPEEVAKPHDGAPQDD